MGAIYFNDQSGQWEEYRDPGLLPDGTYAPPSDPQTGAQLGFPNDTGWNAQTGNWMPNQQAAPTGGQVDPPAPTPQPISQPNSTSGGGGGTSSSSNAIDPSYLQPWTGTFDPGARARIPDYQAPAPFSYADFQSPAAFRAPTAQSILDDPSYQFRMDQGRGAVENSAAAKGTLNTGGTLGDILKFGQQFASNEYSNIWNRDMGAYQQDWQHQLTDYTTKRNNAADLYATNYGVGRDTYATNKQNADTEYQRAWNQYLDQQNVFYKNQDAPFSKLLSLTNIGANAAAG